MRRQYLPPKFLATIGLMSVALAAVLWMIGCGGKDDNGKAAAPPTPKAGGGKAGNPKGGPKGTGNSGQVDDAPAVALQQMFDGLANSQPVALWNALPASYQEDLNSLTKSAIESIDPQVRMKFFMVLNRVSLVLSEKKALIMPALRSLPESIGADNPLTELMANYDNVGALSDTLSKSELANPAWQQAPDLGALLAGSGALMMDQGMVLGKVFSKDNPMARLAELKGALVSMGAPLGTNQVVIITTRRTVSTNIVLKVDGKWLPASVVLNWAPTMRQLQTQMAGKPMNSRTKKSAIRGLDVLGGALLSIEQAQDAKGMRRAVANLMRVSNMLAGRDSGEEDLPSGRRNEWNFGVGDRKTRIDAFSGFPKSAVQQVFGPPDSQVPSKNRQQAEFYWHYRNLKINDKTKNKRATQVYFGFKGGVVVKVIVAP